MSVAVAPWSLGTVPASYVLSNVRVVLGDRVTDEAAVAVEDGRIVEVVESSLVGSVDGGGLLLAPGFIDTHSDALEKERAPRPSAELPWDFALGSFESKVAAAGITTIFHGAGFHSKASQGVVRSPRLALDMCRAVDAHRAAPGARRVDHHMLHRFNVRADGADLIQERLDELPSGHRPIMLSHEDHTPGQGQYADVEHFIESLVKGGEEREAVEVSVRERIAAAKATEPLRDENLAWAGQLAGEGRARLLGHDVDSAEGIDQLVARGGAIAEFPTTWEAARRAREVGLVTVAGAPNVLRGGSHSGNVAAGELIAAGLVDGLSSDYLPSGLLGAVAVLTRDGLSLPAAIALVTSGPARVAGFDDRGSIAEGQRADFAVIDDRGAWPHVVTTMRAAER